MLKLSNKWAPTLINVPETGMDYQICTVVLNNGKRFEQVVISGGHIVKIRKYPSIPFEDEDIADIIVTHDKWDFQNE